MIQRVQSVFLLLVLISLCTQFMLDYAVSANPGEGALADQVFNIYDHPILLGLASLGCMFTLMEILLYKNRKLQINLGYATIGSIVLLAGMAFYLYLETKNTGMADNTLSLGTGWISMGIGVVFAGLALRYIKKDEKLVNSMDRLR